MRVPVRSALILAVAFSAAACQTIGPGSVQRDRLDYAGAIAEKGTVPQVPIITIPAN